MEQLKKISTLAKPPAQLTHKQYINSPQVSFARESGAIPKKTTLNITNHKAADQEVIEKRLVRQLGDRYVHANLIELRPNSYLISQQVDLQAQLVETYGGCFEAEARAKPKDYCVKIMTKPIFDMYAPGDKAKNCQVAL